MLLSCCWIGPIADDLGIFGRCLFSHLGILFAKNVDFVTVENDDER